MLLFFCFTLYTKKIGKGNFQEPIFCLNLAIVQRLTPANCKIYKGWFSRPFDLHLDFWKSSCLEKLRSVSNLRKISVPAHLIFFSVDLNFFSVCQLDFFQICTISHKLSNYTFGHLICTFISENQGLDKSRSVSNLIKISVPVHLNFFSVCHLNFFQVYGTNLKKNPVDKLKNF